MKTGRERKLVDTLPVAKFWYPNQQRRRHPVRRTVLVTGETDTTITGYELRHGATVRTFQDAVKSDHLYCYQKEAVTRYGQYCRLRETKRYRSPNQTTMRRLNLLEFIYEGV